METTTKAVVDVASTPEIARRAMILDLSCRAFVPRVTDKPTARDVEDRAGAQRGRVNVRELLTDDSEIAQAIAVANGIRARVRDELSVPYLGQRGRYLVSVDLIDTALEEIGEAQSKLAALADSIARRWESEIVPKARADLAALGKNGAAARVLARSARSVRAAYSIDFGLSVLDSESHWSLVTDSLSDDLAERLKREAREREARVIVDAQRVVFERIVNVVGDMASKLSTDREDKGGNIRSAIFRDSLVENVRALTRNIRALNVTGDDRIDALAVEMQRNLSVFSADALRSTASARRAVAEKAAEIAKRASAYL